MLTHENIVALFASVLSASKLLIFATSLTSSASSRWLLIMLLIGDQQGSQKKEHRDCDALFLAPPAGLEPATS